MVRLWTYGVNYQTQGSLSINPNGRHWPVNLCWVQSRSIGVRAAGLEACASRFLSAHKPRIFCVQTCAACSPGVSLTIQNTAGGPRRRGRNSTRWHTQTGTKGNANFFVAFAILCMCLTNQPHPQPPTERSFQLPELISFFWAMMESGVAADGWSV